VSPRVPPSAPLRLCGRRRKQRMARIKTCTTKRLGGLARKMSSPRSATSVVSVLSAGERRWGSFPAEARRRREIFLDFPSEFLRVPASQRESFFPDIHSLEVAGGTFFGPQNAWDQKVASVSQYVKRFFLAERPVPLISYRVRHAGPDTHQPPPCTHDLSSSRLWSFWPPVLHPRQPPPIPL
jgi:hypothetical protein